MQTKNSRARARKRRTPAQRLSDLGKRQAFTNQDAAEIRQETKSLERHAKMLTLITCSETWFEDCWNGTWMLVRESAGVFRCRWVPAQYPPGLDRSLMCSCRGSNCSGKLYPPQYINSSGYCKTCEMAHLAGSKIIAEMVEAGIHASSRTGMGISMYRLRQARARNEDYQGGF